MIRENHYWAIVLAAVMISAGCISAPSPTAGDQTETTERSQAELQEFERVNEECSDKTGLGNNVSEKMVDGERIINIRYTIVVEDINSDLNASLHSNQSERNSWVLNVSARDANTTAENCTGRIKYDATIVLPEINEYNISILHNGAFEGNLTAGDDGSRAAKIGGEEPPKTPNTTSSGEETG